MDHSKITQVLITKNYTKQIQYLISIINVPVIFLKGAKDALNDPKSLVNSVDIDILIKKKDLIKCQKSIIAAGYLDYTQFFSLNYLNNFGFHYVYTHKKFKHAMELHWALFDKSNPFNISENEIWLEYSKKWGKIKILRPEFEAIYLIISMYFKDFGMGFKLNSKRITQLTQKDFKWNLFEQLAIKHNCTEFINHFFKLPKKFTYKQMIVNLFFRKISSKKNTFFHFLFLMLFHPRIYLIKKGFAHTILEIKYFLK